MLTGGTTGGSTSLTGISAPGCAPLAMNKVAVFDCGTSAGGCHGCTPTTLNCPDPMLGMGTKDLTTGRFTIPVSALMPGHFVYATDGCNDPGFQVGAPVVVYAPAVAPLLSRRMVVALVAALSCVGLLGLLRLRIGAGDRRKLPGN
jgi:hypothetical protein